MDDTISRQEAIDELIAMREHIESRMSVVGITAYEMAIEALREPERKKGKWMIDPLRSTTNDIRQVYRHLRCSECGHQEPWPWLTRRYFCPNCGADMREKVQQE